MLEATVKNSQKLWEREREREREREGGGEREREGGEERMKKKLFYLKSKKLTDLLISVYKMCEYNSRFKIFQNCLNYISIFCISTWLKIDNKSLTFLYLLTVFRSEEKLS